jgi:hypothetical protein
VVATAVGHDLSHGTATFTRPISAESAPSDAAEPQAA